ncbi:hypothetical protein CCR97_20685 [Rhodoplanes elegans]|uniref:SHSP domain-containing protein n=2 Tax=Rhodoplanes elegans TaxID=29408 RepID=A0A327KW62_9BRAD|nr:hypothetical protein [Rhodoplanes elegans]RAI41452.1 hypothetical protein CH338_03095 [Rhodoplanes elegans]
MPSPTPPAPRALSGRDPFERLRRQMDRLFEDFGRGFDVPFGSGFFAMRPSLLADEAGVRRPAVDLVETDAAYQITAELPGIPPEAVQVTLADGILTIKGEKKEERDETREGWHVAERRFGSFQRSFQLPAGIAEDAIAARVADGVLTVTLPKAAEPPKTAKTIAVEAKG